MAGKNYNKITERLPNVSSNMETIFSSDERLISAKQYVNHYRSTKSLTLAKPSVLSKGNYSYRAMKEQIKNQFSHKSSTARSTVVDEPQPTLQQPANAFNHSIHNFLDEDVNESMPKESKYTLKESNDNIVFADTTKTKSKITPTNNRYVVDNYDDSNSNIDINKSHHSNVLNSPPHRRSFNNVGNLSVMPGDIACNEFLMKRSGLNNVSLTQRRSRSSQSNESSGQCKRSGSPNQLTQSVEIEDGHKQLVDKGNYCINIFPLSMSVHLKMKQNEFNKKKHFNKDTQRDGKSSNANADLSYVYNTASNNNKMYSRDISVDNEDDIVNFKTSINNNNSNSILRMNSELIRGDGDENAGTMVNPFGKSVDDNSKEVTRNKQKIKVIRKFKKKGNEDDDVEDGDEQRYNYEEMSEFEFKDEKIRKDSEDERMYANKDPEIRVSQVIKGQTEEDKNENDVQHKEMRKQQLRHKKPHNDVVSAQDEIDLEQTTRRSKVNKKDDECNGLNKKLLTKRQDDFDDNDVRVNKGYSNEDMEKINEKESVEEIESDRILDKDNIIEDNTDNINDNNDSVSSNEQLELSQEHPIMHSDNQEQELAQFTPQSTPNPKSQHSSTEPNSHKPFPPQEHPHQFNSAFIKETPTPETESNLLKDDSSYKNKTQHKPQFIPPETVMALDTPINPLTPHSYPNNIITLINEKLNSLVNAINTFDTGVFVFNIQNGQIANEQRYQSTNELYKAMKDEHEHEYANDLRICDAEQNSFAPVCKDTTRGSNENMVTKENDFSLIGEQRDKGTNAEASINKVVNDLQGRVNAIEPVLTAQGNNIFTLNGVMASTVQGVKDIKESFGYDLAGLNEAVFTARTRSGCGGCGNREFKQTQTYNLASTQVTVDDTCRG